MSETLYRKYRPTTFADVAGQDHIKTILRNQLKQGTVAHAYLFAGPRGVGKTTIARLLSKAINCLQLNDGQPCGACAGCLAVSEGKTMDVFEIDAASHTGVDNVRENVIEAARFAPTSLKKKVFIIDEVHGLSTPAFNALLKTLEEPPAHVLFILATTELHKVPETILSRCQRFDFHRLSAEVIVERLGSLAKQESVNVDNEVLVSIARLSEGCLRDAESLLGQIFAIGDGPSTSSGQGKKITMAEASLVIPTTNIGVVLAYLEAIVGDDASKAIATAREALQSGVRVHALEDELLEALQFCLLVSIGSQQEVHLYDAPTIERLKAIASNLGVTRVDAIIKRLLEYRRAYANERIPEFPLELVAIESGASASHVHVIAHAPHPSPSAPPVPKAPTTSQPSPTITADAPRSTVSETPSQPVVSNATVKTTINQVKTKWSECCLCMAEVSGTLPVMLQDVEFLGIEGSTMRVGTKIGFIAEKINEPKNRGVVAGILQKVFGETIHIRAEVVSTAQDELVSELIGEFGGQVV